MKKERRQRGRFGFLGIACCGILLICVGCGKIFPTDQTKQPNIFTNVNQAMDATEKEAAESVSKIAPITQPQEMENVCGEEVVEEQNSQEQQEKETEKNQMGLSPQDIDVLKGQQAGNYYYELLNDPGKTMYVEMLQILRFQKKDIILSGKDVEHLGMVYQCVINDHPELFYLSGYSYVCHKLGDELQYITFSGSYLYDMQQVQKLTGAIEGKAKEILAGIPAGTDSYGIVKYVYEYIILHTEYSFDSKDNQNICSVFLEHKSVCNGYAKAFQYLLQRMQIPCILVVGQAGGGSHAWNIVQLEGAYYQVDVTWGDPSYYNELLQEGKTPDIDYSYLCVPTKEMEKTHKPDASFPVPTCYSLENNYFVREGLYFTQVDEERIGQIFEEANQKQDNNIVLKGSDAGAYQALYDYLITQENIFKYCKTYDEKGNMTVSYSGNEDAYTLNFWN